MAYMNQDKKAKIKAALDKVMPKDWKYTLSTDRHTIKLWIMKGPAELMDVPGAYDYDGLWKAPYRAEGSRSLNGHHLDKDYAEGPILDTIRAIQTALDTDNHDRSDIQSDYFDVGHYTRISIGRWDKAFVATSEGKAFSRPPQGPVTDRVAAAARKVEEYDAARAIETAQKLVAANLPAALQKMTAPEPAPAATGRYRWLDV